MNVLITGGAGFIGSHLAGKLLERGERVIAVDDFNSFYDPKLKLENISGFEANPGFTLCRADIRDARAIARVVEEHPPHVVCHMAARAGVRPSIEDPLLYEETNLKGTLNILEAVKGLNLENFVFASSSSVYGAASKVPFSEDDPVNSPISPYAATKRAGELLLFTYSHLYKIPVTCLRFFTVYGERGRPDMAVARFTKLICEGGEVPVYGDGSARRDFTYIGDILKGLIQSLYTPFPYEIINLGGAHTAEVKELVSIVEKNLGKRARLKYLPPAQGDVPVTYADVSKAKRLLGYSPEVTLDEGVGRYVRWFLDRVKKADTV
ncbi:MAG: GDP-mannose 4,6-dehydratase [Deltaproteobacteria bacterium]|nr:GDP-mannose 4,6-dehydratase [Deltaproteobacteria bacterium]